MQLIWPWQDRNRRFSWLKASTFALLLLPAIRSAYLFGIDDIPPPVVPGEGVPNFGESGWPASPIAASEA